MDVYIGIHLYLHFFSAISEAEKDAMRLKLIANFDEPVPQVITITLMNPFHR